MKEKRAGNDASGRPGDAKEDRSTSRERGKVRRLKRAEVAKSGRLDGVYSRKKRKAQCDVQERFPTHSRGKRDRQKKGEIYRRAKRTRG